MRKIKIILYSLIVCVIIMFFSGAIKEFDQGYIAGNPTTIDITGVCLPKKINPNEKGYPKMMVSLFAF